MGRCPDAGNATGEGGGCVAPAASGEWRRGLGRVEIGDVMALLLEERDTRSNFGSTEDMDGALEYVYREFARERDGCNGVVMPMLAPRDRAGRWLGPCSPRLWPRLAAQAPSSAAETRSPVEAGVNTCFARKDATLGVSPSNAERSHSSGSCWNARKEGQCCAEGSWKGLLWNSMLSRITPRDQTSASLGS